MYRLTLFIILLVNVNIIYSQERNIQKNIKWQPIKTIKDIKSDKTIKCFYFSGAVYDDYSTFFPYYTDYIKINKDNIKAEFTNLEFERVPSEDLKEIENLDQIPSKIDFFSSVYYQRKEPYMGIKFVPLRKNGGFYERLTSFTVRLLTVPEKRIKSTLFKKEYASESVLKTGEWYKIKVFEDGIYKLTYSQLKNIGLDDPAGVRVYGFGGGMLPFANDKFNYDDLPQKAIYYEKGGDGVFNEGDHILFYAQGTVKWQYNSSDNIFEHQPHLFSGASYYFLTSSFGVGKTISTIPSYTGTITDTVTSFDDYSYHEKDDENLIRSGRELYEKIDLYPQYSYSFNFPNIISEPAKLSARVVGRSEYNSTFNVGVNGNNVLSLTTKSVNLGGYEYASSKKGLNTFIPASDNLNVTISYNSSSAKSHGWLDYICLNVRRSLRMSGSQMIYRDMQSVGSGRLSKFVLQNASSNIEIWDVTDPVEVKRIDANLNGSNLEYVIPTDTLKEFIAFNKTSGFKTPVYQGSSDVGYVNNQDLHGLTPPDMIIYSHPDFISYANQLADIHRQNDGMNVLVTTPQLVYNEFSSGAPDVSALRNFLRMFYDNASLPEEIPRYLLLFGDGSYYNTKSFSGNTNYIFTYQSKNSLNETTSFTSDDYFALLDPSDAAVSGIIDVGVGRIPVKSTTEAQTAINKIKQYISPSSNGDWKNILTFIGDDEDGNSHMRQSDELAEYVDTNYPSFNIEKIYLDAFQQETTPSGERYPDVHDAIENRINNGTLILNYTGHGGELGLAHERIIETTDIVNWKNAPKFPLFITASCEVCRFDDYERTSGGELMYLNAQGGAIALFTTTRLVYSDANSKMNKKFFKYFFERDTLNEKYRLGDVFMFAKREVGVSENNRKFALIGDPALELAYPDKNVVTNTINEKDIYADSVTISALSKVTVKGHVENINGVKQEQFDGLVYPVVYDKKLLVTTLANDGGSPFKYKQRSNILYRGKVSVNNGEFSFSFVVPKDISYKYGTGKISYYAYNNNVDFQGSCEEFYIGGTADSIIEDNEGPEIDIYLNDKNFVSGGITDESPELLAFFRDSSGINTMGTGIGHDITVMLDNKQNNKIVLNKYYEADLNTYKSGKVNYDFSEIPEGSHTLFLKAWDVYNNSSEESIDFIVTSKEDIKISHVFNYPNPFTTYTEFHFAHNQANQELDVMIKIFTISGKLVKTIRKTIMTDGFRSNEITWNGLDDYGDRIGKGVYVYQLRVRTPDGKIDEKIEKLVILR